MSTNARLAAALEEMAQLLELTGADSFRASAHARVGRTIADLPFDIASVAGDREKLRAIPGVGEKIADKVQEFVATGAIAERQQLLERVPAGLLEVLRVPGLGPKTVKTLWQQLGVCGVDDLRRVIADGSILTVPRMGEKAAQNIAASLQFAEKTVERVPLGVAWAIAEVFADRLRAIKGVEAVAPAGSLRRGRDTIGDIDLLAAAKDAARVSEAFRTMPEVAEVIASGEKKSSVRVQARATSDGKVVVLQADLRVVDPSAFGAALLYFTGSKAHNVRLRERAQRMGMTLNEYGLFPEDDEPTPPQSRGVRPLAAKTEDDIYAALSMSWIPPEMREDQGEMAFAAASAGGEPVKPPRLVEAGDIRAELHAHTTASDGCLSIVELAEEAKRRGFHTIAVTDHSKGQGVANGLSPDRLRSHIAAIREADARVEGITILAGSEVDIKADGSLDYDDDLLSELDVVVASPHAALKQTPQQATKRLLKALRHPLVNVLGHPTGRLVNRREGLSPDIAELVAAAVEHDVALEINAHWARLDLRDAHVRQAVEAGALIAIDCDVHATEDFDNLRFGVTTGRRGWLTADRCVNTWPAERLRAWLRRKRQ